MQGRSSISIRLREAAVAGGATILRGPAKRLRSRNWRAARLIAVSRLVLAILSLLIVRLDAKKLGHDAGLLQAILVAYAVYALITLEVLVRVRAPLPYPVVRHALDVLVVAVFLYGSAG